MTPSRRGAALLSSPLALILILGIVIPAGIFLVYSFFTFELRQVQPGFTLDSYTEVLKTSAYRTFAWNTIAIAVPVALFSVIGGFVLAHYIAFRAQRTRTVLLALVTISMLGSYLARVYAWRTVLGESGVVNEVLLRLHLVNAPVESLLFSRFAVIVAEVNLLMPLVTLLIYAGLVGVPDSVRESARDLGAGPVEVLRRVTLPLCGSAVLASAAFAFFLSAGDYITPVLLGGKTSATIGTAISDQLRVTGNYALGSALSVATLVGFAIAYLIMRWWFKAFGLLPRHVT